MGRPKKKVESDLSCMLAIDFGGSGTKGIASIWGGEVQVINMEPEVAEVRLESLSDSVKLGSTDPENVAWVGVGDEYRAVGFLAATKYRATRKLVPKKYIDAVYKVLAAVWVMQQRLGLGKTFKVAIAMLLPPGEMQDTSLLLPMLKSALGNFQTPTGNLQVNLVDAACYPEGAGVYMMYSKAQLDLVKQKTIALLMVGYRNASVLVSRRGAVEQGKTSALGMAAMIEKVTERTSGYSSELLLKAVVAAGLEPKPNHFWRLVDRTTSSTGQQVEIERLIQAITLARTEYLMALRAWLGEVLPSRSELDELVICGGTADYLKGELELVFPVIPTIWHGEIKFPPQLISSGLGNRLIDVYALSQCYFRQLKLKYDAQADVSLKGAAA